MPAKKIYHNDGTGRFSLVTTFGQPEWNTRHVAVGDVNDDGLPDMVLANRNSRQATASYLCLGIGGGRVAEPCREVSIGSATTISVAAVNGDGALDLIVPHRDGGQGYVCLNNGAGTVKDGLIDIVVARSEATNMVYFGGRHPPA